MLVAGTSSNMPGRHAGTPRAGCTGNNSVSVFQVSPRSGSSFTLLVHDYLYGGCACVHAQQTASMPDLKAAAHNVRGGCRTFLNRQWGHHQIVVICLGELALDEEEVGGQLHGPAQRPWPWPDGPLASSCALCQQHRRATQQVTNTPEPWGACMIDAVHVMQSAHGLCHNAVAHLYSVTIAQRYKHCPEMQPAFQEQYSGSCTSVVVAVVVRGWWSYLCGGQLHALQLQQHPTQPFFLGHADFKVLPTATKVLPTARAFTITPSATSAAASNIPARPAHETRACIATLCVNVHQGLVCIKMNYDWVERRELAYLC
jgi:hypothetical protein